MARNCGRCMTNAYAGVFRRRSCRACIGIIPFLTRTAPPFTSNLIASSAFVHNAKPRSFVTHRKASQLRVGLAGHRHTKCIVRKRRRPGLHLLSNDGAGERTDTDVEESWDDLVDDEDIMDLYPVNDMELFDPDDAAANISPSSLANVLGDINLAVTPSTTEQPDIAYFYLKDKLGLSDEIMWKITFEAGNVLGLTAKNLEWKISVLRRNMNLSDEDIREIISKYPAILHKSADKNLAPTILLFVRALDLSKANLRAMVLKYPCIMGYRAQNLLSKVNFFTETMGFTIDETRKLVVEEPRLMCAAVRTGLMPRMGFLHKEMAIPMEDVRKIVKKMPRVLLCSIEHNLREKLISFLVMRLRMESRHVCKILLGFPQLLDYNLEDTILPIAQYFMSDLEFSPIEFRAILLKHPRLLSNSLRKIKHIVGLFRYEFDLDASQVKRIVYQAPQTFGVSDDNLKAKIGFLRDTFQLDSNEIRKVVVGMPTLLLLGIETNLRPKTEYLLQAFGNDISALKSAIVTQPSLLGYSLKKRIEPRMKSLIEIGAHPRSITVGITMTDDNFRIWLEEKAMKIVENGGKEPPKGSGRGKKKTRPTSSAIVLSENIANGTGSKVSKDKDSSVPPDRSSRIVHWKR